MIYHAFLSYPFAMRVEHGAAVAKTENYLLIFCIEQVYFSPPLEPDQTQNLL